MTNIKICGIKSLYDALSAVEAGSDYLGFNFFPESIRFIEIQKFIKIGTVVKKAHPAIKIVGVFVNSSSNEINTLLGTGLMDLAQLHGDESPEFCKTFNDKAFKAFRGVPKTEPPEYVRSEAPAFMIDGSISGSYGGTGITADWPAAAKLANHYALFLAGGLKPENVGKAIQQVNPWGVDVASGVESSPGKKDANKINAFIKAVRSIDDKAGDRQISKSSPEKS